MFGISEYIHDELQAQLCRLCPNTLVDSYVFPKQGYSCNFLAEQEYASLHISPEKGAKYASLEASLNFPQYEVLKTAILRILKPELQYIA